MSYSIENFELVTASVTVDKRGLADRYMIGIRTVEAWQSAKIIRGTRQGKRIFFDVGDCDRCLKQFSNQKGTYERN